MYRVVVQALAAILVACIIGHLFAPIGGALNATLNSVARTLRRGADDAAE